MFNSKAKSRCIRFVQRTLAALLICAAPAHAINDEIQVYTEDINEPGQFGLGRGPQSRVRISFVFQSLPGGDWSSGSISLKFFVDVSTTQSLWIALAVRVDGSLDHHACSLVGIQSPGGHQAPLWASVPLVDNKPLASIKFHCGH